MVRWYRAGRYHVICCIVKSQKYIVKRFQFDYGNAVDQLNQENQTIRVYGQYLLVATIQQSANGMFQLDYCIAVGQLNKANDTELIRRFYWLWQNLCRRRYLKKLTMHHGRRISRYSQGLEEIKVTFSSLFWNEKSDLST